MSSDSVVVVGLDVHKDSIMVAYSVGFGDVENLGKISPRATDIDRLCKRMQSKASQVMFVYEAGPCGYGLHRQLTGNGHQCMVSPSPIPRKPGERVKTDRRDSARLVRSLRAGDLSPVHVPTIEDEACRDLVRALGAARQNLKQARRRLKAFLLVHDVRYTGRADWGHGAPTLDQRLFVRSAVAADRLRGASPHD